MLRLLSAQGMRDILKAAFASLPRGEQSRIANELGVSPQRVNKWRLGHNSPGPEVDLRKLEELLHIEPGELGFPAGSTPLGGYNPAEVMKALDLLSERLDAVERKLGIPGRARRASNGRIAPQSSRPRPPR